MKKETFAQLEKICKEGWEKLARYPSKVKGHGMRPFLHYCPACEIASRAGTRLGKQNCKRCPVDKWRALAIDLHAKAGDAVCAHPDQEYYLWIRAMNSKSRKKSAKVISEMSWSFMMAYVKISERRMKALINESISLTKCGRLEDVL